MSQKDPGKPADQGISKLKLAIGAASLFLFIIGVKRTFQMEQGDRGEKEPEQPSRQARGSRKP